MNLNPQTQEQVRKLLVNMESETATELYSQIEPLLWWHLVYKDILLFVVLVVVIVGLISAIPYYC